MKKMITTTTMIQGLRDEMTILRLKMQSKKMPMTRKTLEAFGKMTTSWLGENADE
jgi:hypothetical protein